MTYEPSFSEDGVEAIRNLVSEPLLQRIHTALEELEHSAASLTRSSGDFVLESRDIGGWAAWQLGLDGVRGTLRSVSELHVHCPDVGKIAAELGLEDLVLPAVVGRPLTQLVASCYWAKPASIGSPKPWHQDLAYAPPGFLDHNRGVVTVWIAVDSANEGNGCLEFVPGSHRHGQVLHVGEEREPAAHGGHEVIEPQVTDVAPFVRGTTWSATLGAGSAVVFDGLMLHRSGVNHSMDPRRAVSFVYSY